MKKITKRIISTLGITLMATCGLAQASDFPTKPINIIVPYKAGGATDIVSRIMAKNIQKQLGQPVVVNNRTGGGGAVGASFMKNMPSDGYTVLVGASEITTWIPLTKQVDYNYKDFRHIAAVTEFQNALITTVDKPYKDLDELVKFAKANPGLKVAHQGAISEMMLNTLAEREQLDLRMITVSGGAEMIQLLLGGQVDIGYSGGIHNSYPGKFEVISSLNKERLAQAPNKLSFTESGYDISIPAHLVFIMNAATPDANVKVLEKAILQAAKDPDVKKIIEERMKAPLLSIGQQEITQLIDQSQLVLKTLAKK